MTFPIFQRQRSVSVRQLRGRKAENGYDDDDGVRISQEVRGMYLAVHIRARLCVILLFLQPGHTEERSGARARIFIKLVPRVFRETSASAEALPRRAGRRSKKLTHPNTGSK